VEVRRYAHTPAPRPPLEAQLDYLVLGKTHELSSTLLIVALAFSMYFVEPWLVHVLAF
jgi:hypothetical protein